MTRDDDGLFASNPFTYGSRRQARFRVAPGGTRDLILEMEMHDGPGTEVFALAGLVDGRPVFRPKDKISDPGILLDRRWVAAIADAVGAEHCDSDQDDGPPTVVSSDALDALRAELEEWRAQMAEVVDVDRARIDRIVERLTRRGDR